MNTQVETYKTLENGKFNGFEIETISTNDNFDSDSNIFNEKINSVESIENLRNLYLFPTI